MTKPNDPVVMAARFLHENFVIEKRPMMRFSRESDILAIIRDAHKPLYDELAAAKALLRSIQQSAHNLNDCHDEYGCWGDLEKELNEFFAKERSK